MFLLFIYFTGLRSNTDILYDYILLYVIPNCVGLTSKNKSPTLFLMEIAITIDSDLLNKAMQTVDGQSQRQLVENALRLYVLQNKQGEARKYRGKLQWEGNLDELRAARLHQARICQDRGRRAGFLTGGLTAKTA